MDHARRRRMTVLFACLKDVLCCMLCYDCEVYRFPQLCSRTSKSKSSKQVSVQPQSHRTAYKMESPAVSTANANDAAKEMAADCNVQGTVSVNELLAYISFYRNAASQSALLRVCSSFYTAAEISAAKKCLIANFRDLMENSMLVTERRSSSSRSAHEAELEDIVEISDYLDSKDLLGCVSFTAANMYRLPGGYATESINICNVVETQSKLDARVDHLSYAVQELRQSASSDCVSYKKTEPGDSFIIESFTAVKQKLDKLSRTVQNLRCNASGPASASTSTSAVTEEVRAKNIIVFGLPEDRDSSVWRSNLMDVLKFTAGHTVEINDAFRIGPLNSGKVRPVVVKLPSIWDKCLVLSNCRKLGSTSDYMRKVYIAADEPVEVRRKRVFDRIKAKAERSGKVVVVDNEGVLVIDNVKVYSLRDGPVHHG